jgi:hypothetical protein
MLPVLTTSRFPAAGTARSGCYVFKASFVSVATLSATDREWFFATVVVPAEQFKACGFEPLFHLVER